MTAPFGLSEFEAHDTAPQPTGEAERPAPQFGDQPPAGELLTLPDQEAAALAVKLFTDQSKRGDVRRRHAQWEVNRLRREGYCNVECVKVEGKNQWTVRKLPGLTRIVPGWNKADDLCEKMVNQMYVDEPAPDPIPSTAADEDVEAAELAERALKDVQAEGHLDDLQMHRESFDLSGTYSRAAIHYWVDAQGRRGPVQMLAHPQAASADAPFSVPQPAPLDPMTGQPMGEPTMVEAGPPYVLRYVTPDGRLTDQKREAAEQWLPMLRGEVLDPRTYRMLPATARDIWEAEGVAIGCFRTVAELRALFPEAWGALTPEEVHRLTEWKPEWDGKELWPEGVPPNSEQMPLDDKQVWTVTVYYRQCGAYAEGAKVVACGKDTLLTRGPWLAEMPDGTREALDLPLTEQVQFWRGRREPVALMELLGPVNEQRGAVIGYWMQTLEDMANAATFVSVYGTLRPEDLAHRDSKYLPYVPGHPPVSEQVPEFPASGSAMFELTSREMDTVSGLDQTGRLEDPNVKSGIHAQQIRSQALVAVSGLNQNVARCYTRACRIQLQLMRWQFTKPQMIGYVGEDGQYRADYFTGMDLGGTRDVRLKKGSLTMLSSSAKAQEAVYYAQVGGNPKTGAPGVIPPDELRDILASRLGSDLGIRDNPHRQRVKRQIHEWGKGPPEGWQEPAPTVAMDPTTGQPVQMPGVDPTLQAIFAPIPADAVPEVAMLRFTELGRAMATLRYAKQPPAWRLAFDAEFERMRQAAGVQTVAEAAAAQQQAAMQQEASRRQQVGEQEQAKASADQRKQQMQQEQMAGKAQLDQLTQATEGVA